MEEEVRRQMAEVEAIFITTVGVVGPIFQQVVMVVEISVQQDVLGDYRGLGGKALSTSGGTKIFLGGGGGAGHANGTVQPFGGGNGGGIIIVLAKNVIGNGYKISANGQAGRSTSYDGAAGGGAGGTIIMNVTGGYSGSLNIQANGGNGGNEDDDNSLNRCYGAGGGGSGGVLYFNGSLPSVTTYDTAGTGGINMDVNGCGTPQPAFNGTDGSIITGYSYRTSVDPSSSCSGALPVRIIYFNALLVSDRKVKLEWDIANPEEANSFTIEKIDSLIIGLNSRQLTYKQIFIIMKS